MSFASILKVELHAHLNGSLRRSTLLEFLQSDGIPYSFPATLDFSSIFDLFSKVHSVITTPARLLRVTQEILEDFEQQNCFYLELRTTPKSTPYMSKHEYVETILNEFNRYSGRLVPKLLISINRGQSIEDAWENLQLAQGRAGCVGIEFSGHPRGKKFKEFLDVFQEARRLGIKVAVHAGEIVDEEDIEDIVAFVPNRLGHCCFLTEKSEEEIIKHRIPIEMCYSSNLVTAGMQPEAHHFGRFYERNHPIAICTDDTMVLDTNLSLEFQRVAETFKLNIEDLEKITQNSINMAFSPYARLNYSKLIS